MQKRFCNGGKNAPNLGRFSLRQAAITARLVRICANYAAQYTKYAPKYYEGNDLPWEITDIFMIYKGNPTKRILQC
jgi:hypothetical protein